MKRYKTGDYKSALSKKGFKSDRHTGDEIYYLYVNKLKTQIFTKVSHGPSEDIGNSLLKMIKLQLNLDTKEIDRFIGCPMDHHELIETLHRKNVL